MIKHNPKSVRLAQDDARAGVLRFSWAYTLTIEALHVMCTGAGNARDRLVAIDPEFIRLKPEDFPEQEGVRERVSRFQESLPQLERHRRATEADASTQELISDLPQQTRSAAPKTAVYTQVLRVYPRRVVPAIAVLAFAQQLLRQVANQDTG